MTSASDGGTMAGTAGGTLLAFLVNLHPEDVLRTVLLASIGAVVSFTLSILLKWMATRMRRKR